MPIIRITEYFGRLHPVRMGLASVKEFKMKSYSIKGIAGRKEVLEVLRESKEGYQVKIIRDRSGWMEEKKEFMPKELFETCLRTEYLTPISGSL